jgi:hypothetical protein
MLKNLKVILLKWQLLKIGNFLSLSLGENSGVVLTVELISSNIIQFWVNFSVFLTLVLFR